MVDGSIALSRWAVALFATIVAGATFGLLEGGIAGLIVGGVVATIYGTPVVLSIAVVTWAFWLTRYLPVAAAIAGAATGVVSTKLTWDSIFSADLHTAIVLAAAIGGAFPGLATTYYLRWRKHSYSNAAEFNTWQFSLADLFWRFTILGVLIAMWTIGITKCLQ